MQYANKLKQNAVNVRFLHCFSFSPNILPLSYALMPAIIFCHIKLWHNYRHSMPHLYKDQIHAFEKKLKLAYFAHFLADSGLYKIWTIFLACLDSWKKNHNNIKTLTESKQIVWNDAICGVCICKYVCDSFAGYVSFFI